MALLRARGAGVHLLTLLSISMIVVVTTIPTNSASGRPKNEPRTKPGTIRTRFKHQNSADFPKFKHGFVTNREDLGSQTNSERHLKQVLPTSRHNAQSRFKRAVKQYKPGATALKDFRVLNNEGPRMDAAYEPMQQCPTDKCNCSKDGTFLLVNCRYQNLKEIPTFKAVGVVYDQINFGAGNTIKALRFSAFQNLQVHEINLENNMIETVDDGAFLGVAKVLKKLSLQGNQTAPIPFFQLSSLQNLTDLKLKDFTEKSIPQNNFFGQFNQLEVLELTNIGGLTTIDPRAFTNKLPRLNKLKFDNVPFGQMPLAALEQLKNLTSLTIEHSEIQTIFTKSFTHNNLQTLRELTLANNQIKNIDIDAFEKICENLEELNLFNNYLITVQFLATKVWKKLYSLNLSYNYQLGITSIDSAFRNMPNLQHLFMENINLQTISRSLLTGLKGLKNLKLSYNRILAIEDGAFYQTPNLLEIQLDCQFCNEPSQAVQLELSPSKLDGASKSLMSLNLNETPLKATAFWNTISIFTELQSLFLENTRLARIPDNAFAHNTKLQVIALGQNGISFISDSAFLGLQGSLKDIGLQHNNLTTVNKCVFRNFSQLETIKLYNNPLHCDCELTWLHSFINSRVNQTYAYLNKMTRCKTPTQVADKPLNAIPAGNLSCSRSVETKCYYVTEATTRGTTPSQTTATTKETMTSGKTTQPATKPTQASPSVVLYVERVTETSFIMSWTMYGIDSPVKGFNLTYTSVIENKETSILLHPDSTRHILSNLNPGSVYQICISVQLFVRDSNARDCKTRETLSENKPYNGIQEDKGDNTMIIILVTVLLVVVLLVGGLYIFVKYKLQKLREIRLTMESAAHRRDRSREYCEREDSSSCTIPNEYTDIKNAKLAEQYKIYSTKVMQRQYAVDNTLPSRGYSTYSKVKRKKQSKPKEDQQPGKESHLQDGVDEDPVEEQLKAELVQRHSAPSRLDANDLLKTGGNRGSRPLPATPDKTIAQVKLFQGVPMAESNNVFMTQASVYGANDMSDDRPEGIYHEIGATDTLPRQ